MKEVLETKVSKGDELSDFVDIYSLGVNDLRYVFGSMNNIELIEEYCAHCIEDESSKNYAILEDELGKRKKDWIKDLSKTKRNDFRFYMTLKNRGLEPAIGKLNSLRGAVMSVHGYHTLKAGTIEVELTDGSKKNRGYSEKLGNCKPSRIREFAKNSYFHGEEIYGKILSGK